MLELIINSDVWKSFSRPAGNCARRDGRDVRKVGVRCRSRMPTLEEMRYQARHAAAAHAPDILIAFLEDLDKMPQKSRRRIRSSRRSRFAARVRGESRAGQALHVPALLVRANYYGRRRNRRWCTETKSLIKRSDGGPKAPRHTFRFPWRGGMAFSSAALAITGKIDRFNRLNRPLRGVADVPLVLAVSYEVILRYVFNTPTILVVRHHLHALNAAIFMMGAAMR